MWNYTRTRIYEVIKAYSDAHSLNWTVYREEVSKIDGYPAIIVAPSEYQTDYTDTNNRGIETVFTVRAYVPVAQPDGGQQTNEVLLENTIDTLIEIFSQAYVLGNVPGEEDRIDWVRPSTGAWGYAGGTEVGQKRFAELKLRCVSKKS